MPHEFGNISSWTKDKLDRVQEYLNRYMVVMTKQRFHLEYIDAFAGTGYVNGKVQVTHGSLFDSGETTSLRDFIDGSVRLALQTTPPFSKFTFIESHQSRCNELLKLKDEFPSLATSIEVIHGEANIHVQNICKSDWLSTYRRGVMFLDPYGARVSWQTIRAIANTKAIDLWLLFPIGTVNRLLNNDGQIVESRVRKLNQLFGDQEWYQAFFEQSKHKTLFGTDTNQVEKIASFEKIAEYFVTKLRTVFVEIAPNPLILRNSTNSPIFMLCFAAGNRSGAPIAVKIAQSILNKR
ncbi:MAG: three-Cys-motif partner protein TcmP [Blastocatellia bacterium]